MATKKTDYPAQIKALKEQIAAHDKEIEARDAIIVDLTKRTVEVSKKCEEIARDFHESYSSIGDLVMRMGRVVDRYQISSTSTINR